MTKIESKHLGAYSEIIASKYLFENGFDVFRSLSQHGPCDIIAMDSKNGHTIKVDVKTAAIGKNTRKIYCTSPTKEQRRLGIRVLAIVYEGSDLHGVFWEDEIEQTEKRRVA